MGSRKLTRVVRRQTPGNGGPKPASAAVKPFSHHGHSDAPRLQRLKEMQSALGNQKVQSILEKKLDAVTDASARESLEKQARQEFVRVIGRVPTLLGVTGQLAAMPAGPIEASPLMSVALVGFAETTTMLQQLDAAIEMFEKSGGDITEIREIIAIRAHLSTLMFYLKGIASGAPFGPLAMQTVQEAIMEGMNYQVELALKKALNGAGAGEQPPAPAAADQKKLALAEMFRRLYLGPPGLYPSAKTLKSM